MKQFEDLKGKDVQLVVRFKNDRKDYFYHGEVVEVDKTRDKIWIDDMIAGKIWFWRNQIQDFRVMEYHDYLKLTPKSERARVRMKLMQADMRVVDTAKDIKKKLFG